MSLRSACALVWVLLVFPVVARAQPPSGVKAVEYEAKSVGRTLKYFVALPEGYESGAERYPVLYLLHGYSGNYNSWAKHRAQDAARPHGFIVVMPDGGNSWFVNWSTSEGGQNNAWEDSVVKDLIPHVDATYRTIARREGRAINGLSMGGYGAAVVGLATPTCSPPWGATAARSPSPTTWPNGSARGKTP
ncbi:MAG: alpha/beta hydrolase-fold protein [Isosphaeraceae bacterium]